MLPQGLTPNTNEDEFNSSGELCIPGENPVVLLFTVVFLLLFYLSCCWCCCTCFDRTLFRDYDFGELGPLINWTFCFPYYCCKSDTMTACRRGVPVMMRKIWDLVRCVYLRRKIREDRERKDQRLVLLKRWKPPQSKHDEDIADAFVLPKEASQIQDCIRVFKAMEQALLEQRSWDAAQKQTIQGYRTVVVEYLRMRLQRAQSFQGMERLLCCYHMDELVGRGDGGISRGAGDQEKGRGWGERGRDGEGEDQR